jgi:hypothetical protein
MADKLKLCAVILGLAVALLVGPAGPKEAASAEGGTTYSFSGYIKTDIIFNPGFDGGDNFYATRIPLGSDDDADQSVGFTVRQSRIRFDSKTDTALGALSTRIETDFLGAEGTPELRLRHAYGQLGAVLVGQAWSILGDDDTYATTVESDGPLGVVSRRAPQIRYTQALGKSLTGQLAIEDGSNSTQVPNFLAALRYRPSWGAINLSGVLREYRTDEDNLLVYGVHVGANVNVLTGKTKLLATFNVGSGVAGYLWSNASAASLNGGELKGHDVMGGFVGITHSWTDTLRSGLYYGWDDHDDKAGNGEQSSTIHANVFLNPVPQITVGLEYIYGQREVNDEDGDASRVQLSFQYNF